jgi:hypothetical protein
LIAEFRRNSHKVWIGKLFVDELLNVRTLLVFRFPDFAQEVVNAIETRERQGFLATCIYWQF